MILRTDGCRTTRHSTLASRVLLALAVLALAACYLPPFDEKLSESEYFAAGLDHVATLHPDYIDDWMYEGGYFLPSREFDAAASPDGFWVRQSGTDLVAAYVRGSSIYANSHSTSNELGAGFVAFPLTEQEISGISTSTPKRGLLAIFGSDAVTRMPALATDTGYGLSFQQYPIAVSPTPTDPIIGASFRMESQSLDRVSILYQSSSSPPVFSGGSESTYNTSAFSLGSIALATNSDSSGTVPALKPGAFFGYCPDNAWYYVSGYRKDDSTLYSAYWPGQLYASSPVKLSAVEARIAAILSTGRLLAIGDGIMYVYSLEGSLVTSFTTGSMHFAYEYYDSTDGLWYCYFTRAFRVKDNDGWKVYVDVYRCRSTALDSLGN